DREEAHANRREGADRRGGRPAPMRASCCMCGTRKHSSVPDLQAPTTRRTSSLGSYPIMTPAAPCAPRPKQPRRLGFLPPESAVSSAGAVDTTGQVKVLLGRAGQNSDQHDSAGVDGDDLGHGRVRFLIADDNIVTDAEHNPGL